MENQTLVVLDGNQVTVESLRIGGCGCSKRAYGAERAYAKGLNQIFAFDWFVFEASDTSDDAKTVKVEKTCCTRSLKRQSIRTLRPYGLGSVSMVQRTDMVSLRTKAKAKARAVLSATW
jgi:hypothetical protein